MLEKPTGWYYLCSQKVRMFRYFLSITLFICFALNAVSNDSVSIKTPRFITLNATQGHVFETNKFVSGANKIPYYKAFSLKYGVEAKGDDWTDYAYGMPHVGIGLYIADFGRKNDFGNPFSVYLLQGARLREFSRNLSLNYEWNLGGSFNWKHYDAFESPENIAIGSSVNIHAGGNLFFRWRMSPKFDLHLGASFNHFSNGASSLPNKGLNMISGFVELSYLFNREEEAIDLKENFIPPPYEKHISHDIMVLISNRQARIDTLGTGLSSKYFQRKFTVLGINYSYLFSNSYRYKWGPSLEATYDESSGIKCWGELHPETKKYVDRTKLGHFSDRLSLGISLKGEIIMPYYSLFANFGYNVIHGNKEDKRLYQILGVKFYLKENFFGTFGIRAHNFGKAQFLYWNLGYTFDHYPKRKR